MTTVFSICPGATVVLKLNGVYRQTEVAVYRGMLFGKYGAGFVMLHKQEFGVMPTSNPNIRWESLSGVEFETKHAQSPLFIKS
jgi:hypothetical protein